MMNYACPIWRPAAHTRINKLQMLQTKCLRIATNSRWYVSNRQIHENLGIPFFADHIRALTESLGWKLADEGNPLVRQLGRHLHQLRAVWSLPRVIEVGWRSTGQPRLPLRKGVQVDATTSVTLDGYSEWGFPCISSVLRQMPGHNWKGGTARLPKIRGRPQPKGFPPSPKSQKPSGKAISSIWVQLLHIQPTEILFLQDKLPDIHFPSVAITPSLNMSRPSAKTTNPLA
jgi:hypothetical protein